MLSTSHLVRVHLVQSILGSLRQCLSSCPKGALVLTAFLYLQIIVWAHVPGISAYSQHRTFLFYSDSAGLSILKKRILIFCDDAFKIQRCNLQNSFITRVVDVSIIVFVISYLGPGSKKHFFTETCSANQVAWVWVI